jgi:hypothetical protein
MMMESLAKPSSIALVARERNIGEFQIGYIQDFLTEDLAPQMDQGYVVTGIIKDVTGGGDRNYGVNIEIFVKDPGESFEELEVKPETGFMNKLFSLFKKG